jgi:hypothetical protein
MQVSDQLHGSASLSPEKSSPVRYIGGRLGPRAGMVAVEYRKFLPLMKKIYHKLK